MACIIEAVAPLVQIAKQAVYLSAAMYNELSFPQASLPFHVAFIGDICVVGIRSIIGLLALGYSDT